MPNLPLTPSHRCHLKASQHLFLGSSQFSHSTQSTPPVSTNLALPVTSLAICQCLSSHLGFSNTSHNSNRCCYCFIGNHPIPWRFYSDPPNSIITLTKVLFLSLAHALSRPSSLDETVGLGVLWPGLCYPIYSCNSSTEVYARQFSIKALARKCWAWWLCSIRLS